jgi:hypothetical protein
MEDVEREQPLLDVPWFKFVATCHRRREKMASECSWSSLVFYERLWAKRIRDMALGRICERSSEAPPKKVFL